MKSNRKGFTLIELLIVVAIIGIIVAIAIPNLLNAIQRAKQRKTMGDMRSIATAIEAYSVDFNRYPPSAAFTMPTSISGPGQTFMAGNKMANYIAPTYIKVVPLSDGWNSWFLYNVDSTGGSDYRLTSYAKNGTSGPIAASYGPTTDFNSDIIYVNGQFIQYPEGAQR